METRGGEPSVFVIDRMVKLRDFNGVTNEEISLPIPKDVVFPITLKFAPQPLHYVPTRSTRLGSSSSGASPKVRSKTSS